MLILHLHSLSQYSDFSFLVFDNYNIWKCVTVVPYFQTLIIISRNFSEDAVIQLAASSNDKSFFKQQTASCSNINDLAFADHCAYL